MEPMCRLCLQGGPDLYPLQNNTQDSSINQGETTELDLIQLIEHYLSIQVIKAECTESSFICTICQTSIEEWHRFHNVCRQNDATYHRRQSELLGKAAHKEESLSLSTDFKQETEIIAEDLVEDYLDPDFEVEDEIPEEQPNSTVDDDAGSECTTSEYEVIVKVEPPKRKEQSVIPKKRGRPKQRHDDDAENASKSKKRTEVCTICGKFIKNITEHMRIHNNERRHQCPYCPKAFVSASNYCSHVNIHTRAKMYKCDLCDKQYAILNSLKQHRITHFKERIYLCPVCGKSYYQPTGLARHKRTHFEEPKIKCSECDKMFLTNSDLRKHFTKHLTDKPFSCEICSRAFSRKDNLQTHMKTHRGPKSGKTKGGADDGCMIKVESPKVNL